jgi:hypothetical protein
MKYENKWLIKFLLNTIGFGILIVQSIMWIIFTYLFILGYIVFIYEFTMWIYVLEFMICLYGFPFVVIKCVLFLRNYLFKDDFIE